MIPNDNALVAGAWFLGWILALAFAVSAFRWLIELHAAGMRRLAIHRARQHCVNLDSWREHVRSVRCER